MIILIAILIKPIESGSEFLQGLQGQAQEDRGENFRFSSKPIANVKEDNGLSAVNRRTVFILVSTLSLYYRE